MEREKSAKLQHLQESLQANPEDSSLHFDLGVFLWENWEEDNETLKSFKEKAAEHFLASARLNPQNGDAFRYLGHYYYGGGGGGDSIVDPQRAVKCYQRALSLNPDDSLSGESLCDLFDSLGKVTLELTVCRDASQKSPRAFWAFRRLGYLQLHERKWSEAVISLQHAIRGYPSCADLWEALGLAYNRLGRFTAAIKSYGRAIDLEPMKVFALVESGNIYVMLGSFKKGVEQFRLALEISPQCISANYGLASGLFGWAKECIYLGAFQWGATLLEEASKVAIETTSLAGNLSCIWKLHGDIQLTYAKCYPWMEESQSLELGVSVEDFNVSVSTWKQACCLAATSAKHSYQRALLLTPWEANFYADIAISSDIVNSFTKSSDLDINVWQPPEKMALGALLLEPENHEFWVALGCLSNFNPLKQHSLIRSLQLDVSHAVAWSYLGKIYREMDEKKLARLAFDCSRSIDPSLALPWAGMSADFHGKEAPVDEAFESCLRAVQTLPLAEFQIGLAKLAVISGHLSNPQVFGAIRQAVQRAPQYPESHNLKGLVCEARFEYQTAATSYRLARCALTNLSTGFTKSQIRDISINLARSLFKAGNALDAVEECENLKKEGLLDGEGLQIYALSLWKLGQSDLALSVAKTLAANVSTMDHNFVAAPISLICRLLYYISGQDSAINIILKMPKELFQSSKISFVVSAIHALDGSNRLEPVVSTSRKFIKSHEDICGMHCLIALGKLLKNGSGHSIGLQSGVAHLRKVIHMYPNSCLLRNLLGYLLLSGEEWNDTHLATRCCNGNATCSPIDGLKSAYEIVGAGAVACYAIGSSNPKFTFPTCPNQCLNELGTVQQLQKRLRQEPWNRTLRYLLILNLLQKAREERFPRNLCTMLERLISVALSNECYSETTDLSYQYEKFQLLLCASEISLQSGNQNGCIEYAKVASTIAIPDSYLFFAHLLLCRAYASDGDVMNLKKEYLRCLELETDCDIGWICLKMIESQYTLQNGSNILELYMKDCLVGEKKSWNAWMALYNLVQGLIAIQKQDLYSAKEFLEQACTLSSAESCIQLCYGSTCLELAKEWGDSELLLLAIRSLTKAQKACVITTPLPIISALLAQAEGSIGSDSKEKWEKNLRLEWYTWSPEMRPAELFFQMHLLAKESRGGPDSSLEYCQTPLRWVLRAVHTNPSCMRYWKVLQKLLD